VIAGHSTASHHHEPNPFMETRTYGITSLAVRRIGFGARAIGGAAMTAEDIHLPADHYQRRFLRLMERMERLE
jgi:hypothetical protein